MSNYSECALVCVQRSIKSFILWWRE